jgi:DNA-binding transcriptional ArsR family regulator
MASRRLTGQETFEIDRPDQLKALGHPLRLKVLQALGDADKPLTNRELAARLEVDPGHLHFHVRMLAKAGLIELAPEGRGREKPYRAAASHLRIGPEIRAAGLASEVQAAQLRELQRAFDRFASAGELRTIQVHAKVDPETMRELFAEVIERLSDAEDEEKPLQTLLIAFHPAIEQGEQDES